MTLIRLLILTILACTAIAVTAQPAPSINPYADWTLVNPQAWTPRASAISAYFPDATNATNPGRWIVIGGFTRTVNWTESTLSDAYFSVDRGVSWTAYPTPLPFIRCEMAADVVVHGAATTLVVSGGIDFATYLSYNDVYRSDDQGATFQLVTNTAPWAPRTGHALVTMNKAAAMPTLVLVSGYTFGIAASFFLNDVWVSNDLGVTWTAKPIAPWAGRGDAGVVVSDAGFIFVVGGYSSLGFANDVWMSSADVSSWVQMASAASWTARWGAVVESFNNTLVIVGGDEGWQYSKNDEVWISENNGANWTFIGDAGIGGRSDAIAEVIYGKLYIAGGEDNNHTTSHVNGQVWSSPISLNPPSLPPTPPSPPTPKPADPFPYTNWTLINPNAWTPRASAISAYFEPLGPQQPGRWLIIGGYTRGERVQNLYDSYTSDDQGATWQAVSNPLPFIRCEMAADVLSSPYGGQQLVISGGIDFNSFTSWNDIWRSTDRGASFQLVTQNAAWPIRTAHGMVTINKNTAQERMLVLGGYSVSGGNPTMLNDVWMSQDLVNWTLVTVAPWAGRGDAGYVVDDNNRLFVIAGNSQTDHLNDVWMTDAAVGAVWVCITPAAAWSARWGAIIETFNNTLVVIGGDAHDAYNQFKHNDVWLSWDQGASWTWVSNATFGGRSDAVAEVIGQYLLIAGGEDNNHTAGHINGEVWQTQIDYSAASEPPTPPPTPIIPIIPSGGDPDHGKKLSVAALVIIVLVVLVVLGLIGYFCFKYQTQNKPRVPRDSDYHLQV